MTIRVIAHGNRFASVGRAIVVTIDHDAGTLDLRAPFYRRTIRLTDIAAVSAESDDGMNHGLVNWFVTGKAYSPRGVRLNTGGKARVDIATTDGARYAVVVDTVEQADTITAALRKG